MDDLMGIRWLTGDSSYPALIGDVVDTLAEVRNVTRHGLVSTVRENMRQLLEVDNHLRPWLSQIDA